MTPSISSTISRSSILIIEELVDGHSENASTFKTTLERNGYEVYLSNPGAEVLQTLAVRQPDLILIGGYDRDLCRRIKQSQADSLFFPVILTIGKDPRDRWLALEAGADDTLCQPLDPDEVLISIASLLRIKRQFQRVQSQKQALELQLDERAAAMERTLRESKELTILKDSIVRNVSHEMRTPLLQVKSAVSMLAEDLGKSTGKATNGSDRLIDYVIQATARLEGVVQNITWLATAINIKSEVFQIGEAINVAVRHLSRLWESSGAVNRIQITLPPSPPVIGNRGGVAQVLQQLIDNALKFSAAPNMVDVIVEPTDTIVWVTIKDHGIGIAPDHIDLIFQAFYQIDSSSTRRYGGTGVGLAIAKLILDGMNIKINVTSQPGLGSSFSFALPIGHTDRMSDLQILDQPAPVH